MDHPSTTAPDAARVHDTVESRLSTPRRWLVTGAAGFIGSHITEFLLGQRQQVVALDNFATGYAANLEHVRAAVGEEAWAGCEFVKGDIRDPEACRRAADGVDFVLHQAALGSVPRSVKNPGATNETNVTGFLNMLVAARDAGVRHFVYASSSSVYGDHPGLPKEEGAEGAALSPYAVSKWTNELYAGVFARQYGMAVTGLRYFNVFGPRQDPEGPYAAVIPRWIAAMLAGEPCVINGDGETSRDFCYVTNAVQANLLAATADVTGASAVYNVACGERTTLNELHAALSSAVSPRVDGAIPPPEYTDFRPGDVRHSLASISAISGALGYVPTHLVKDGLPLTVDWFAGSVS